MKEDYYDGNFEFEGKKIQYRIDSTFHSPQYKNSQMTKASRYIQFYDDDNQCIDVLSFWGEIEKITNLSSYDIKELYERKRSMN